VRYEYRTPGSSEPLEKLTLAHPIDDLGLILCTGTWLDQYAGRPLALYGLVAGLAVALLLGLCVPLLLYGRQMHLHNRQLSQEIAEHEQTRLALEQAKETAEAASRAKTEFLAVISHEIRTPLNAVIGFADFLSQSTEDPSQREVIEEINNNSEHLLTLIDDILNYTSIISGNLELSYRPFSVARVVEEVVSANAFKINEKGLQLHREISPNVPGHLEGDPVRVRQVLSNLVDNAVKFTARGSVWLKAWANKTAEGDWLLHFMVKDTGPGVPAERVESIFNRFEQIDSSNTRRFGGVGLGLAICKSIVERMGGQIRCRSEDGGGAEFTFEIRCREVDVPSGGGFHAKLPETQVQPNGEAVRIVYAEDNPSNQRLMEALLQPHGFDVSIVKDGYGLISSLQSNAYDLALVDLQMPGMDGLEAASRIRRGEAGEHNRQLPIIGITAHALRGDRERCLDSGMDGYLPKPIRQAELLEAIHETLSRRV
jgi:signal transduction histidine kinase/CheY-like chemotaxis protein